MVQEATRSNTNQVAGGDARRLAQQFASRVGRLRLVIRVVALPLTDGLSVWTLLDGDAAGRTRRAVYDAQFATRHRHPDAALEFRVIDAAEFPPDRRASLLPAGALELFDRKAVSHDGPVRQDHAG